MALAHAGHWFISLLYVAPVVVVVIALTIQSRREDDDEDDDEGLEDELEPQ